jgi:hypothetical protein
MKVEIGTEAAQFPKKEYVIFLAEPCTLTAPYFVQELSRPLKKHCNGL